MVIHTGFDLREYQHRRVYRETALSVFESCFFEQNLEDRENRDLLRGVLYVPDFQPYHNRLLLDAINDAIEQAGPDTVAKFIIDLLTRLIDDGKDEAEDEWWINE